MVTAELTELEQFEALGYVVMEGVLDPVLDLQPVVDEYSDLLDSLAKKWHAEGKLSSDFADLPFGRRLIEVARETERDYYKHIDISLSQGGIGEESPIHLGQAVFDLRYNPIGQPTGRPWFPGFVARSRANPESVLPDRDAWEALWMDARDTLAGSEDPTFRRWDPDDPRCA